MSKGLLKGGLDVEVREVWVADDGNISVALQHLVYNKDGSVKSMTLTELDGISPKSGEIIPTPSKTANLSYTKTFTGVGCSATQVESCVITLLQGSVIVKANGSQGITLGDGNDDIHVYKTESHNGDISVELGSDMAKYQVEYRALDETAVA